jgi:AcrR family transcriptional regulator
VISQARAEVTRQVIIDAGVEVVDEAGYSAASLTEVIDRAGVTKGAFYYHFPTKTHMGLAIVAESDRAIKDAVRAVWDSSPAVTDLENLVRSAFVIADRARSDRKIRVGIQLTDSLGKATGSDRYGHQRAFLVHIVRKSISDGDIRAEVNAEDLGHALWVSLLGNHLLSEISGEDSVESLARILRSVLAHSCTDRSGPYFEQLVDRLAGFYTMSSAAGQD